METPKCLYKPIETSDGTQYYSVMEHLLLADLPFLRFSQQTKVAWFGDFPAMYDDTKGYPLHHPVVMDDHDKAYYFTTYGDDWDPS